MVAKGMLKEHLILLANSMTCSGNLIGFNLAGIKELSRSLNVQVPFTEATLFTPKKCFELAAEKCHVDLLASIVASWSWGKPVAVGTGSSFDILNDTGEVELNQSDVYDFLNLVRSSLGVEKNSSCLGDEMDDLDWTSDDYALSPEHASENPVFEDSADSGIANQNVWDRETQSLSENVGAWGRSIAEDSGMHAQWSAEVFREEKAERYSEKVEEVVARSFPDETENPEKNNHPVHVSGLDSSSGWTKEDQGTSFAGDRRRKSSHPFNKVSSESVPTAMTASGRRLDMFTDDEQELLVEIEPIMQSVRKIMNQPGYNDGDPLATDDQGYIIEHIFNFHPNKVVKMGAGIDYVMIDKHSSFQNTRCFAHSPY